MSIINVFASFSTHFSSCSQGKAIGVAIGCILGMFPLLFFKDDEEKKKEGKEGQPASKDTKSAWGASVSGISRKDTRLKNKAITFRLSCQRLQQIKLTNHLTASAWVFLSFNCVVGPPQRCTNGTGVSTCFLVVLLFLIVIYSFIWVLLEVWC